jgi:uncharacterized membrane protein YccC
MQAAYLREIMAQYREGKRDDLAYRLARRNAHNADAALSAAMSAVLMEPYYVYRDTGPGKRFLVLSHTLLNYLSALGSHRGTRLALAQDRVAGDVVNCLLDTLDALADALTAGQALSPATTSAEAAALEGLSRSGEGEDAAPAGESLVLLSLWVQALRLLPALREQAGALAARPGAGPDGEGPSVVALPAVSGRSS